MKVRATQKGYYDLIRRYPGDEFQLREIKGLKEDKDGNRVPYTWTPEQQFSKKWMEKVDDDVAPKGKSSKRPAARVERESDDVI